MDELMRFLDMGGYARYVWPSFIATALVLGRITWMALFSEAATLAAIKQRQTAREEANR